MRESSQVNYLCKLYNVRKASSTPTYNVHGQSAYTVGRHSPRTVRIHCRQTLYAHCPRTASIQCRVPTPTWRVQSIKPCREVAAGMCEGYIFVMRRKKQPKYAKRFWTRRLFNDGLQYGNKLLRELNTKDDQGISSG